MWIQTYSGVAFDLRAPRPEDVRSADLAHALAFSCRFGGHTRVHASVAQHSILVAAIVWRRTRDRAAALHGLLHDAHEAYTGDIKAPVKALIDAAAGGKLVASIEAPIDAAVFAWAGLVPTALNANEVKIADREILFWERERFVGAPVKDWPGEGEHDQLEPADFGVGPGSALLEAWQPGIAERAFMHALAVLVPDRVDPSTTGLLPGWLWHELRRSLPADDSGSEFKL